MKSCKHCATPFETNHKRAIYCGDSCRQLAYQARHRSDQEEPHKTDDNLALSMENVAVTGAGALVGVIANYALNDAPFYEKLDERLKAIEYQLGHQAGVASGNQKSISNFIKAMRREIPSVDQAMRTQEYQAAKLLRNKGY